MRRKVELKEPSPDAKETAVRIPKLLRKFLWAALCISTGFLFLAVVSAPLTSSAMLGLTGGNSLKIWTIICALCGLSLALDYATDKAPRRAGLQYTAGDVWALYVLFLVFLGLMGYFVHLTYTWTPRGLMYEHDAPQYYMQLHSFLFDQDADFTNEYGLMPRITEDMAEWRPNDVGTDFNVAPVGSAMLWMPFYLAAFPSLYILKSVGVTASFDGVSSPFAMAAGFGSGFLVWIGMMLLYSTLRRWFSYRSALATALFLYGATNLTWYVSGQPWMSHCVSFFASAAVLYLWIRTRDGRSPQGWLLLGTAIGLAMLVRPSHVALIVLPLADIATAIWAGLPIARALRSLLLSSAGVLLVFSAQLATWYARSGMGVPPGSSMAWSEPALGPILFSSQNGLIAWHPITWLGFLGVPLLWRRSRWLCLGVGAVLALNLYLNAAIADWSGGASFGMRRFVGILPFMAPGIAAAGSFAMSTIRRSPWVLAGVGFLIAAVYNISLMTGYKEHLILPGAPAPFSKVWSMGAAVMQDNLGHPFSFPANYIFSRRHGVSPTQYDLLSSDRAYGRDIDATGILLNMYLGKGWEYKIRDQLTKGGYATALEKESHLLLPLKARRGYKVVIEVVSPLDLTERQIMTLHLNDHEVGRALLKEAAWSKITFELTPKMTIKGLNDLKLSFQMSGKRPDKVSPAPEDSVLGLSEEVRALHPARKMYWGSLRSLKLTAKADAGSG